MIAYVGMPSFVVTLGMLSIARSLAMVLSNNRMVYEFGPDQANAAGRSAADSSVAMPFREAIRFRPLRLAHRRWRSTGFAYRWTRWGRHMFAIGGNEDAAILTGVPVRLVKIQRLHVLLALRGHRRHPGGGLARQRSQRVSARAWS